MKGRPVENGATYVEATLALLLFFILVLCAWSLGIALLRYSVLADSAANVLRRVSVTPTLYTAGHVQPGSDYGTWVGNIMDTPPYVDSISLRRELCRHFGAGQDAIKSISARGWLQCTNQPRSCEFYIQLQWPILRIFPTILPLDPTNGAVLKIAVSSKTSFEDPEFLYCNSGCPGNTGNAVAGPTDSDPYLSPFNCTGATYCRLLTPPLVCP